MASAGHFAAIAHSLQLMQRSWRICRISELFPNVRQPFTHTPHPMHFSSSITYW